MIDVLLKTTILVIIVQSIGHTHKHDSRYGTYINNLDFIFITTRNWIGETVDMYSLDTNVKRMY